MSTRNLVYFVFLQPPLDGWPASHCASETQMAGLQSCALFADLIFQKCSEPVWALATVMCTFCRWLGLAGNLPRSQTRPSAPPESTQCHQGPRLPRKRNVDVTKCHYVPRLPRASNVNASKCHGCHPKVPARPSAPPNPTKCHKCHACRAKATSMSPSATPRLPRKSNVNAAPATQKCHGAKRDQARHQSQPSATPAQKKRRCHQVQQWGVCVCVCKLLVTCSINMY